MKKRFYIHCITIILFSLSCFGCTYSFVPPIKPYHYGAPGALRKGDVKIGFSVAGFSAPFAGGPFVNIGLSEMFSLELGGNLCLVDEDLSWGIGFTGLRYTWKKEKRHNRYFSIDLDFGMGVGAGGKSEDDDIIWNERLVFGLYQGGAIGGRIDFYSIYLRAHIEEVTAQGLPWTYLPSALVGHDFTIAERYIINLGVGYIGHINNKLEVHSIILSHPSIPDRLEG